MPTADLGPWGAKQVLTATFDTLGGANLAVKKLQEFQQQDLLDLENTITVSRNAWDKLDVHQTTGDSAKDGAGIGALVGAVAGIIFPPSLLATTALGAVVGGMTGVLRGSYFDDSYVKAMGEALQPGQSMLIAIMDPRSVSAAQSILDSVTTDLHLTELSAEAEATLTQHANAG